MTLRNLLPTAASLREWLAAIEGDEKFVMVIGAGAVASTHLSLGQIDQGTWLAVVSMTVGAYIGGKVIENTVTTRADARVAIAKTESRAAHDDDVTEQLP